MKNKENFVRYKNLCSLIDSSNPFYKIDLILNDNLEEDKINYFLFSPGNIPKVIMLFNTRKIKINSNKTSYKDVVSPYGYSGPLISELTTDKELSSFWVLVDTWYRSNNIITEFIRFSLNNNNRCYSGTILPTLKNVQVEVFDEAEQWERFDKKVRNNYRKAVQNKLTFKLRSNNITDEILVNFYDIYHATMIRKNAENELFYSVAYFKNYVLNNPTRCAIAMVYLNDIPISTEFLLLSNDTIYSYLGGTNSEFFKTRPNDFLKVEVLHWARSNGFKYYVLGGGRVDNDPLYTYKKSFSPKDKDLIFYTGRKILNQKIYNNLVSKRMEEIENFKELNTTANTFFPGYRNIQ
ncbi:GNAT family N-acetyltransferase [Maribacter sp. ACAM166]|uniref:GNAT family N-acetyltransferase n=1 Tax=Maribacter sp. ACAM166 TaxID=2508996 RepID=UPI001484DBB7|nr:GNAT family N-acetyltransferase [Maribacter sp. ACAM166]